MDRIDPDPGAVATASNVSTPVVAIRISRFTRLAQWSLPDGISPGQGGVASVWNDD